MENAKQQAATRKLPIGGRRAINASMENLVDVSPLRPEGGLPLLISPAVEGVDLIGWAAAHRELIDDRLLNYGGILFRGFQMPTVAVFEQFVRAVSSELLEYRERSSPRSKVSGNIYTSTDHPPDQHIFLHNENSYQQTWPLKIFFYCVTPAQEGGATTIADVRRVAARVSPQIRERFIQKGVMYVRNFGDGFGLPWQTVFQTDDPAHVDAYCRNAGIITEWKGNDRLRTRQIRTATAKHPRTGEMLWFNHATFFHVTTLEPAIRDTLLATFAQDDLPTNSFYGDGSPIEPEALEELRAAYYAETISFPWQQGDIMMLDNMLAAHGRAPFAGPRKVVVGMSEPVSRTAE